MSKHSNNGDTSFKRTIAILLTLILISATILIIKIKLTEHRENEIQREISQVLNTIDIPQETITPEKNERQLQIEELQKENKDIVGWLEIAGTNINYPVLQGKDNDYYLNHNYRYEKISSGSIFLDKDYDFSKPSTNLLIYGHRNKQGLMFEDLINYKNEDYYKEHKEIRFTTPTQDLTFEVIAAFNSRVYYKHETNVFRYYYFVNANNRKVYEDYINNSKQASLYDTGKTAVYGERLLTLSTCDYSQENGRFAIVAKQMQ